MKHKTSFILFKNLIRSLLKNWKQLISIIAISFLAICLFSGLTSNAENLSERADYLYQQSNYADLYATTSQVLTQQQKDDISALDSVDEVEGRMYVPVYNEENILYLVGADDSSTISVPMMIDGDRGLCFTDTYASNHNLEIGSSITLSLDSSYLSLPTEIISLLDQFVKDGKENILALDRIPITFTVTGLMYHPEAVQNSTFSLTTAYADKSYIASSILKIVSDNYNVEILDSILDRLSEMLGRDLTLSSLLEEVLNNFDNQLVIKSSDPEAAKTAVEDYLGSENLLSCTLGTDMSQYTELKQECDQALAMTFVFPIIFFLVSILVILTTLSQMIIKDRSQIGALKAIGVPKWKIYLYYTLYGVVLCFIGALLGFIVGPLFIPKVLGIKYSILWDVPSLGVHFFYPLTIMFVLLMLALAALCSFLVSFKVIKEKPCDTLKPKVTRIKGKAAKQGSFIEKHTSISTRMAFRNILRNKGKSLMVILGTLGCTALLVCGFGIMDTLNYDISLDFDTNQRFDLSAVPDTNVTDFEEQVMSMEGVEHVDSYSTYPVTITGESQVNVDMTFVEDDYYYLNFPIGVDGGVTLDQKTAEKAGVSIGDIITIVKDNRSYQKEVTSIVESSFLQGVYDLMSNYQDEHLTIAGYYIDLKDGSDVDEFITELKSRFSLLSVLSKDDVLDEADNILSSISMMTDIVKIFAILLSIVVIYNLTSLNIAERTRDIATMKVLGFHFGEISKTLTIEIMMDVFIGSIIGIFVGYPLMALTLEVNQTSLLTFIYHIEWYTYLLSFVIALAASLIVSLLLNLKSKKINMAEALKSIE